MTQHSGSGQPWECQVWSGESEHSTGHCPALRAHRALIPEYTAGRLGSVDGVMELSWTSERARWEEGREKLAPDFSEDKVLL